MIFRRRKRSATDFDDEIAAHLEAEAVRLRDEGASVEDARAAALRAFGNVASARERFYEARRWLWLDHTLLDLRYAFHTLRANAGYAFAAIATIALAIGANSAIFTVVHAVLLRPLPYPEPERLVGIVQNHATWGPDLATWPDYTDWRDQSTTLEAVGGTATRAYNLTGVEEPERLQGAAVTPNLFAVLRAAPALGRSFTISGNEDPGVVVISHGLWLRRFGGSADAIGRRVSLNGQSHAVIGVMPRGFAWPESAELWVPLVVEPGMNRGYRLLLVAGRLNRGATLDAARAELETIAAASASAYPQFNKDWGVKVTSLLDHTVGAASRPLLILAGAVLCVLLIACANVAGLLTSRAVSRRHEMCLRGALGASRSRLVRQLVTESLVLSLTGGAVGLALASFSIDPLLSLTTLPRAGEISIDSTVLLFTFAASLATGLAFGLAPALAASRVDLRQALSGASRGSAATGWVRPVLLVVEVASAVVLLAGAGLLMRSFYKLHQVDTGFDGNRLITTRFFLPRASYPVERCVQLYRDMIERVTTIPGVEAAAAVSHFPLSGASANAVFEITGRPPAAPGAHLTANFGAATPGYFRAMGVALLSGRDFDDRDRADSPFVAVVSRSMADRFFPGQNPIGQSVRIIGPRPRTIVGIVSNVRQRTLEAPAEPEIYVPHTQFPSGSMFLVVRASGVNPAGLGPSIRTAVRSVDPDVPIAAMRTGDELRSTLLSSRRFSLLVLSIFATTALLLSVVGTYAVLAYGVSQRTREIGIRMALGAASRDVLRLTIRQGMVPVVIGLAAGLAAALASTKVLGNMLFEIPPSDPITLAGVAMVLLTAAFAAVLIPARKAARVDPAIALQ